MAQGRQVELPTAKLDHLTNVVMDYFQETEKDIWVSEYESDIGQADPPTSNKSLWDMEDGEDDVAFKLWRQINAGWWRIKAVHRQAPPPKKRGASRHVHP